MFSENTDKVELKLHRYPLMTIIDREKGGPYFP